MRTSTLMEGYLGVRQVSDGRECKRKSVIRRAETNYKQTGKVDGREGGGGEKI